VDDNDEVNVFRLFGLLLVFTLWSRLGLVGEFMELNPGGGLVAIRLGLFIILVSNPCCCCVDSVGNKLVEEEVVVEDDNDNNDKEDKRSLLVKGDEE